MTTRFKYVIIGNSAGGIGAAEAIREKDEKGSLLMISEEPYPAYSRPLISKYLAERCSLERMLYRPADFYVKNDIQTIYDNKVTRLDTAAHTLELADGQKASWEKLLLATGGTPIVPPMDGVNLEGVFSFVTLNDAKAIDNYLKSGDRVVVIGGGLIGVSVTEALIKRRANVTIVEMKDRILNIMLDEETSSLEEVALKKAGVNIITGHTVTAINGDESVDGVTLDDGSQIPCELVVVAIGVRPRTELTTGTDIKIDRGILVDLHMTTSNPDVYACGDAAEAYDFVYNMNRLTPIWPNAYIGGRAAGFNMAGVPAEYPGGTSMNSLKYFGLDIVSAGMVITPDESYEEISRQNDSSRHKVILKDGIVMGMIFAGNVNKSGVVFSLMKEKVDVRDFKEALIAEELSLAALPEEIWRKRLAIPREEAAVAISRVEEQEEEVFDE